MDLLYIEQLKDELNINVNDISNLTDDFQEMDTFNICYYVGAHF